MLPVVTPLGTPSTYWCNDDHFIYTDFDSLLVMRCLVTDELIEVVTW